MADPRWAFALRGEGTESLEIDIYDHIGESWWSEGVSAKSVRARLKEAKDAKTIRLRVNSGGGDVIDGFAIYNLLNEHPARVEADVDALAASMASVVLMAADEIRIAPNGFVMIHNPWGLALGEADEMRATADLLDKMRMQIAAAYVARTGLSQTEVLAMMDAETWLAPEEAKAKGFVDKVKPAKAKAFARAGARGGLAGFDLRDFRHVPAGLLAAVAQARTEISGPGNARAQQTSVDNEDDADEERIMADELKTALATLGVASVAEVSARLALLTRIETATGKTGDEAQGLVMAALASHAELPKAKARIAELEKSTQDASLEAMIAKGKSEHKLTPALEKTVRDQYAAGEITLKGADAWLANLTPIAALAGERKAPAAPASAGDQALTWNGKTYAQLSFAERAQLKNAQPELFEEMRKDHKPGAVAR